MCLMWGFNPRCVDGCFTLICSIFCPTGSPRRAQIQKQIKGCRESMREGLSEWRCEEHEWVWVQDCLFLDLRGDGDKKWHQRDRKGERKNISKENMSAMVSECRWVVAKGFWVVARMFWGVVYRQVKKKKCVTHKNKQHYLCSQIHKQVTN